MEAHFVRLGLSNPYAVSVLAAAAVGMYIGHKFNEGVDAIMGEKGYLGRVGGDAIYEFINGPDDFLINSALRDSNGFMDSGTPSAPTVPNQPVTQPSPIILDLDGDGVETVGMEDGVHFDHDGNRFAEKTGWVHGDDALLIRDLNGNGIIDGGGELFGSNTLLGNGNKAANGFVALAEMDSNKDGVVDKNDAGWGELRLWQDKDGDGVLDAGEMLTMEEAGVAGLNVSYKNQNLTDENGNQHKHFVHYQPYKRYKGVPNRIQIFVILLFLIFSFHSTCTLATEPTEEISVEKFGADLIIKVLQLNKDSMFSSITDLLIYAESASGSILKITTYKNGHHRVMISFIANQFRNLYKENREKWSLQSLSRKPGETCTLSYSIDDIEDDEIAWDCTEHIDSYNYQILANPFLIENEVSEYINYIFNIIHASEVFFLKMKNHQYLHVKIELINGVYIEENFALNALAGIR